jgi:hypothetical protein
VITQINFSAKLLVDANNPEMGNRSLTVQYMNPNTNVWTVLIPSISGIDGNYDFSVAVDTKIALWKNFSDAILDNFFPALRLVNTNAINPVVAEIIAYGGHIRQVAVVTPKSVKKPSAKAARAIKIQAVDTPYIAYVEFGKQWIMSASEIQSAVAKAAILKKETALITRNIAPVDEDAYIQQINSLTAQVSTLQTTNQNFNNQNITLQAANSNLTAQVRSLQTELQSKTSQINTLQIENQEQETTIIQLQTRIAALENTQTQARTQEANKVYSSVVNEISKATETLNTANSKFQISDLALDLKVLVKNDETGLKLQMVDDTLAESISGDALSNIRIVVKANDITAVNTATNALPTVIGLTETEARKKLLNYGLKLNPIYEFNNNKVIGQAFKQFPESATEIVEGSTVTVFFAKETQA